MFDPRPWERIHASALAACWSLDEVLPPGARFDFRRPLLPEGLARTAALDDVLDADDRLRLNHIRAHGYLAMFGVVEGFILPFVLDSARATPGGDERTRALLQFATEEAKHIALFDRFREAFRSQLALECPVVTTGEALSRAVLAQPPLAVALLTLHIEWMTQQHYVDAVRDDEALEPLFHALLTAHWREEAQHALLDELLALEIAEALDVEAAGEALEALAAVLSQLSSALDAQVELDLQALATARGGPLSPQAEARVRAVQQQALHWTFLGSGLTHKRLRRAVVRVHPDGGAWLDRQIRQFSPFSPTASLRAGSTQESVVNQIDPNTLNGLSLEAMGAAAEGLQAGTDPEAKFAITARWQSGTRHVCRAEPSSVSGQPVARGHEIVVDEPEALLGGGVGMNPQELLLSALATCVATVYVFAATKRGVTLDELEVRCDTSLDLRGSFGLEPSVMPGGDAISLKVHVRADATDAVLEEALQEALALSPNRYQIASPIRVDASLVRL
jgi:uncharacterized OsmC-like protein